MVESAFRTTTLWYKFQWNLNSYSQTLTLLFITVLTLYNRPSNLLRQFSVSVRSRDVVRGFKFKGKLYNLNNTCFRSNTHLTFQGTKLVLESTIVWLLNVITIMAGKWNLNWEQFLTVNIIRNVSVLFPESIVE